jgi:hypothetical protein
MITAGLKYRYLDCSYRPFNAVSSGGGQEMADLRAYLASLSILLGRDRRVLMNSVKKQRSITCRIVKLSTSYCFSYFGPGRVSVTPLIIFTLQNCILFGSASVTPNAPALFPSPSLASSPISHFSSTVPTVNSIAPPSLSSCHARVPPHFWQKNRWIPGV